MAGSPQHPGWQQRPNPGHQPQWSNPQQGWYGPPVPPPPPPRRRGRLWLWLAPALLLVVAAAGGVPLLLSSGDDSPGSPVATDETTDAPAKPAAEDWSVKEQRPANEFGLAAWVVDDLLVFANESGVIAYDRADGAEKWRVTPPDGVFCAASDRAVDGVAVLAFGPGEIGDPYTVPCGTATPLDLRKGELGWQGKFTPPQNVSPDKVRSGAALEIVGDMVVIAQD